MSDQPILHPSPGWASGAKRITLKALKLSQSSDEAAARSQIAERIFRYGWAYDERNPELLGDCFSENGIWEGSVMGVEDVGPFEGRAEIVKFLSSFWDFQQDQRRHLFTNIIIDDLKETRAVAHAYLILTASSNSTMTPVTTGPYRFELLRQADSWRLTLLSGGFDAPF
ncbi:MAG: nuclear transport factor 2 family protein [Sulfobacillus sp.]